MLQNEVIRLGFEPKTHSLEGFCSIQLSYRTYIIDCKGTKYLSTKTMQRLFFQKNGLIYMYNPRF